MRGDRELVDGMIEAEFDRGWAEQLIRETGREVERSVMEANARTATEKSTHKKYVAELDKHHFNAVTAPDGAAALMSLEKLEQRVSVPPDNNRGPMAFTVRTRDGAVAVGGWSGAANSTGQFEREPGAMVSEARTLALRQVDADLAGALGGLTRAQSGQDQLQEIADREAMRARGVAEENRRSTIVRRHLKDKLAAGERARSMLAQRQRAAKESCASDNAKRAVSRRSRGEYAPAARDGALPLPDAEGVEPITIMDPSTRSNTETTEFIYAPPAAPLKVQHESSLTRFKHSHESPYFKNPEVRADTEKREVPPLSAYSFPRSSRPSHAALWRDPAAHDIKREHLRVTDTAQDERWRFERSDGRRRLTRRGVKATREIGTRMERRFDLTGNVL